ncbi:SMC-Scp complex subunit ScpB [Candidatus Parcubacteria bacterium]|nr:SMC-Scp complex subunit ScpB [Candidatus Parcubacteria bacterium]
MDLKSKIESLLFASNKPLSLGKISKLVKANKKSVHNELENLIKNYNERDGGIVIIQNSSSYQMATNPKNSDIIKDFLKDDAVSELSQPSLETLTIICYKGPISKPELEQLRGVNCSMILRNLIIRGLVENKSGGVLNKDKNSDKFAKDELYYGIKIDFLKFLGVTTISELPDYEELSK